VNVTRRKRQVLDLLAEAEGELMAPAQLQAAARRRWGHGAWKFGQSLRELADADCVVRVGERYRITHEGLRTIGRDPRDA
jgi:hypothetical protein